MQQQQPNQRPPQPGQQPQQRPMFRPQGSPASFRPGMQPRPGFQPSTPGGTPPLGHPGHPRPGFVPNRPMMRPVTQSPIQSPAAIRPASPIVSASPIQQHQQPPMSPTTASAPTDHHRRKRMYPEQITKAYSGDVPISPGYPPQQQPQPYGSPAMAHQQPMQQQSQFISPMGTPSTNYAQPAAQHQQQQQQQGYPQQQQQQQQQPVYNAYNQDPVNQMSSQFGNMNMGGSPMAAVSILQKEKEVKVFF